MIVDSGAFSTGTGTGDLAAQTPSLGGATPQLILFFNAQPHTAAAEDLCWQFGAATGTAERATCAVITDDAQTTTDTGHVLRADACLARLLNTSGVDGLLDLAAVGADSFTPTVDDAFNEAATVAWVAFAGLDGAKVGTVTASTDAVNTQAVTGVGFQPDLVIFFGVAATVGTIGAHNRYIIGWADGTTQRCLAMTSQDAVADVNSWGMIANDVAWAVLNPATGAVADAVTLASFDSDGFTFNRTVGTANWNFGYIAIKGVQKKTLDTAMRTDTNNQSVTGAGFQGEFLLTLCRPPVTAYETAGSAHLEGGIGFAVSSTKRYANWAADEDALATSDTYVEQSATRCVIDFDKETGASDEGDMDFVSFDSDGFTLDQDTAAAQATLIAALVIGDAAAASGWGGMLSHQRFRLVSTD